LHAKFLGRMLFEQKNPLFEAVSQYLRVV